MATEIISLTHNYVLSDALPLSLDQFPKLNAEQAGHIRHIHNLATQIDGSWHHMGSEDPGQEWFDAYRYQISNMVYAASLAHYHRLPALRSVFKTLIRQLIHKMLRRDVWGYWYTTSSGGNFLDPSLTELRRPWADPVAKENIMYSGHLLLMTTLYTMLFDDDEFEKPDSIVFDWDPRFWGLGPEKFRYSIPALQQTILSEMEQNGWLGCCCEPNVVFVVCNQFPLIAVRYNDVRHQTAVLDDVLPKYKAAWEKKGMVQENGLITLFWMKNQDKALIAPDLSLTAWAATFLASWNSDWVKRLYDEQSTGYVTTVDNIVRVQPASVANRIRGLVAQAPDTCQANSAKTISAAVELAKKEATPAEKANDQSSTFGYVTQWLSEMGRAELLSGLLEYADSHLQPTWEDGGLFYPRNDTIHTDSYDWVYMDPYTGNTAIAYARLNVPDGQKKMFEKPWTKDFLAKKPYVESIDLAQGVNFLRGVWAEEQHALVVTFQSWDGKPHPIEPKVNNLEAGTWGVYVNGQLQRLFKCSDGASLSHRIEVQGEGEVDLVLLHV